MRREAKTTTPVTSNFPYDVSADRDCAGIGGWDHHEQPSRN